MFLRSQARRRGAGARAFAAQLVDDRLNQRLMYMLRRRMFFGLGFAVGARDRQRAVAEATPADARFGAGDFEDVFADGAREVMECEAERTIRALPLERDDVFDGSAGGEAAGEAAGV